jgi:hypothetical protein
MLRETIAFNQERRRDLHPISREAKMFVIEIDERGRIGDTARSRQNGDAISSQRIRHGFHVRFPRRRQASVDAWCDQNLHAGRKLASLRRELSF